VRSAAPPAASLGIGAAQIALSGGDELEIAASRCHHSPDRGQAGPHWHPSARLGSGESVEIDLPRGGVWLMGAGRLRHYRWH